VEQILIKHCSEDDVDALRQFIDTHWQHGHILARDAVLLRWQFDHIRSKTGTFKAPSILLAWRGDRIVGMLGLICFDFNLRGIPIPAVWLSHWFTIPEFRAHGIGLKLLWAVHDLGYDAIFVLGINDTARKVYSALGFELLPSMPRWIGVFNVGQTARLLESVNRVTNVKSLDDICGQYRIDKGRKAPEGSNVRVVDWSASFAAAWDSFWTGELAPTLVSPGKDSAYLKWRYVDHPTFKYEMRLALNARTRDVLGLAVFRVEKIRERDERILRVLEFLTTPEAESALALSLIRAAQSHNTIFADFYCTSERAVRALEIVGFKRHASAKNETDFPARFQPMEAGRSEISGAFWLSNSLRRKLGPAQLLTSNDFYVTKSDGDQDRPN
jgi:GNAT superfamily N-acetyltransferase